MAALIQCRGRFHCCSARLMASTGEPTTTPPLRDEGQRDQHSVGAFEPMKPGRVGVHDGDTRA